MRRPRNILLAVAAAVVIPLAGCRPARREKASAPNDVTPAIQAGIEKHIENETRKGNGTFKFKAGDREYAFKLVRIHTEYLANLGPGRHFACVDLVDAKGDVYDVDFFLSGDPGNMTVTETTIHKLNGVPFYAWEQAEDGNWHRIPVEKASQAILGVKRDEDVFEFNYRATLPPMDKPAGLWLPCPVSDEFQSVKTLALNLPADHRVIKDKVHGNTILYMALTPEDSGKAIDMRFHVKRKEKGAYQASAAGLEKHLEAIPSSGEVNFKEIAEKETQGKTTDLIRARALYDHVIDRMKYAKFGEGWGKGDAVHACSAGNGNCTDYHAYFMALARAVNIPARFAIGAAIPSSRDEGGIGGYHCWVEFHADGKWWPVDISEADKYSSLSTYYFGHHPANRVEFSRGRHLVVDPAPASGPINFLAYPLLEVAGTPVKVPVQFTFKRLN